MIASELLTRATVGDYLIAKGLLPPGASPTIVELDGGVSNLVVAVEAIDRSWVVKQSLPKLRVADDWCAKQERIVNESVGLEVAGSITPGRVPRVVSCDPDWFVLVIERAPLPWVPWKSELLAGSVDASLAHSLGQTLGAWHATTYDHPELVDALDDPEAFEQLRLSPYHRMAAERLPSLAGDILAVVRRMEQRRICLVHGDFSPKNILVGAEQYWILDFEVAHRGDPDFDRAFLLTHLLLKAIHRPRDQRLLVFAGQEFLRGYDESAPPSLKWRDDPVHLARQTACLLLSRAVGMSPVEYLDHAQKSLVIRIGSALLISPTADVLGSFEAFTRKVLA